MSRAFRTISIRFRDMVRMRLFVWELREFARELPSPFAERLERIIERFMDGGDDG